MINKRISKITMLTALFIGGIVNAQEFYTCVPKKNTIMNININNVDELAKAIENGIANGMNKNNSNTNNKRWIPVGNISHSYYIKVPVGKYKLKSPKNNNEFIFDIAIPGNIYNDSGYIKFNNYLLTQLFYKDNEDIFIYKYE